MGTRACGRGKMQALSCYMLPMGPCRHDPYTCRSCDGQAMVYTMPHYTPVRNAGRCCSSKRCSGALHCCNRSLYSRRSAFMRAVNARMPAEQQHTGCCRPCQCQCCMQTA